MDEFQIRARRAVQYTLWVTALWILLWSAAPVWKPVFAGLAIGSSVGLYYVVSLKRQTQQAAEVALSGERRRPGVASLSRLAAVLFMAMVVSKLPSVNMFGALAGVLVGPLMIVANNVGAQRKGTQDSSGKE